MLMNAMNINRVPPRPSRRRQTGAALYIALIMLILLALIGIVGMQVSGLQERMAASYYTTNIAFQNAEGTVRQTECEVEALMFPGQATVLGCSMFNDAQVGRNCDDGWDVGQWLEIQNMAGSVPAFNVRKIDECIVGETPIAMGIGPSDEVAPISVYQISVYDVDSTVNRSSAAGIDTVFKR